MQSRKPCWLGKKTMSQERASDIGSSPIWPCHLRCPSPTARGSIWRRAVGGRRIWRPLSVCSHLQLSPFILGLFFSIKHSPWGTRRRHSYSLLSSHLWWCLAEYWEHQSRCPHPKVWFLLPAPLSNFAHVNSVSWVLATHLGDLDWSLLSWFWPGLLPDTADSRDSKPNTWSISLSLSPHPSSFLLLK